MEDPAAAMKLSLSQFLLLDGCGRVAGEEREWAAADRRTSRVGTGEKWSDLGLVCFYMVAMGLELRY